MQKTIIQTKKKLPQNKIAAKYQKVQWIFAKQRAESEKPIKNIVVLFFKQLHGLGYDYCLLGTVLKGKMLNNANLWFEPICNE